ncbi:rod shape-determining protein [Streptomyces fragilis]|uniref:rod shape-determining protein n=1 Tax=Streptomyces fragilis TaxID=67301 RepID=UPI001FE639C6|nr:rod shape-determining protein [Streptomyces fragilis]
MCGVALDLGSARTRAWTAGQGTVLDVPTVARPDRGPGPGVAAGPGDTPGAGPAAGGRPVHRGAVVDEAGCARILRGLLEHRLPRTARPVVVLTTPALASPSHRAAARSAVAVLRPRSVLTVPAARAVAVAAGADLSRPLLVVDIGAHLTEVVLLDDGAVADARRVGLGTGDLGAAAPEDIVNAVTRMVTATIRQDAASLVPGALARGVLLAGGGALRPELTYRLAARLHALLDVVPAPHTAAVRGAARLLEAARLHPSTRGHGAPGTRFEEPPGRSW